MELAKPHSIELLNSAVSCECLNFFVRVKALPLDPKLQHLILEFLLLHNIHGAITT